MNDPKDINRRKFLELSVQGSIGISLATVPAISFSSCRSTLSKTVHGACYHDCPDRCSWKITTVENKVTDFSASSDNPYTAGKLCSKMVNFPNDVTFHPDRILTPLKRVGKKGAGKFEVISWQKALSEIAVKLKKTISEKGGEAILPYSFGGNQGLVQGKAIPNRFFAHIGASQLERTICGNPAVEGVLATNGQTTGVLPEDIVYSKFIILWGTNPVLSNQHLWPFIQKAKSNGAKIVVIDPFQSQTAIEADWHIQIMPGTDTVLALGMINIILSENLQDNDYIQNYTTGIIELQKHVEQYNPKTVSKITGLGEETILELARAYATSDPSLIRVLIGMEHQTNGASAFRSVALLPAITGAWRKLGGGLMHMTYELFGEALNWEKINIPSQMAKKTTRSINMIQLGKVLNDKSLDPPVEALFVFNSNPAVTTPNQNLVIQGLEREDLLTIVIEHFVTDTARYADYIFPATSVLENWDVLTSWGTPYLNINQAAIKPVGEARSNSEFFRLLSTEMGFTESYLFEKDVDLVKSVFESNHEYLKGITFETIKNTGWARLNVPKKWIPHAEGNFKTSSGKCNLYNPAIEPALPEYIPPNYSQEEMEKYPFQLLTIKTTKNFLNSSHANIDYLIKKEGEPQLDISEEDAMALNINNGDQLNVYNQRGEVFVKARVRKKVRKGVVCLPQGFWSSLSKGGSSANALTNDLLTDMGRGAAIQDARVNISKV
jgi:anaerobic selenocysteine-containing dehydrogenase